MIRKSLKLRKSSIIFFFSKFLHGNYVPEKFQILKEANQLLKYFNIKSTMKNVALPIGTIIQFILSYSE